MVHGCMVYTERAEMAAVFCGTSNTSAVSTPLRWILKGKKEEEKKKKTKTKTKTRYKKLVTYVESHASAVSLFESYIKSDR